MADISMCLNHACPSRFKCYRYTAKPNELRQAYADFTLSEGEDKCRSFYPVWGEGNPHDLK